MAMILNSCCESENNPYVSHTVHSLQLQANRRLNLIKISFKAIILVGTNTFTFVRDQVISQIYVYSNSLLSMCSVWQISESADKKQTTLTDS